MIERTELQNYLIKRLFIKNISLDSSAQSEEYHVNLLKDMHRKRPEFTSPNKVRFHMFINFKGLMRPELYPEWHSFENKRTFEYELNVTTLAQWLLLENITTPEIIGGKFNLPEVPITQEFLEWDFPAIQEIVAGYLYADAQSIKSQINYNHLIT